MKHLVIFDCFGVICSEIAPVWFSRHYPEDQAKKLKQQYFSGADRGDVDIDTLITRLAQGLGFEEEQIRREWGEIFSLNDSLVEYIRTLGQEHYLAVLSNAPAGLVEKIFEHFGLDALFDGVFVSSHYKMAKPDKAFYRLCLDAFRGKYSRAYMIDDNPDNLKGLEALSVIPIHFTSNEKLFDVLKEELV